MDMKKDNFDFVLTKDIDKEGILDELLGYKHSIITNFFEPKFKTFCGLDNTLHGTAMRGIVHFANEDDGYEKQNLQNLCKSLIDDYTKTLKSSARQKDILSYELFVDCVTHLNEIEKLNEEMGNVQSQNAEVAKFAIKKLTPKAIALRNLRIEEQYLKDVCNKTAEFSEETNKKIKKYLVVAEINLNGFVHGLNPIPVEHTVRENLKNVADILNANVYEIEKNWFVHCKSIFLCSKLFFVIVR